jgi:hypothetical protein
LQIINNGVFVVSNKLFSFTSQDREALYEAFSLNSKSIVVATGARDYSLNDDAFADAVIDIEQDLQIISYRRIKNFSGTGISKGKMAGIYAFRLSRAPILQFCKGAYSSHGKYDKSIQTLVVLMTSFNVIGQSVSVVDASLLAELIYNMRKRHVNQETLALVIDGLTTR